MDSECGMTQELLVVAQRMFLGYPWMMRWPVMKRTSVSSKVFPKWIGLFNFEQACDLFEDCGDICIVDRHSGMMALRCWMQAARYEYMAGSRTDARTSIRIVSRVTEDDGGNDDQTAISRSRFPPSSCQRTARVSRCWLQPMTSHRCRPARSSALHRSGYQIHRRFQRERRSR